ncbi:MAG: hypothetical protein GX616_14110 [Planctomycetes bacterium]|nr:hypothetical protein [Planctomycetota bacterium]
MTDKPAAAECSPPRDTAPHHWPIEQQLLHYIADRDVPCPVCGYNLRALTVPRCPECGREVVLSIRLVEPYMRAWVTLAVAVSASAGVGLFLILILVMEGRLPSGNIHSGLKLFIECHFIGSIPAAVVVLLVRRWFLRRGKPVQWTIAIVGVLMWAVAFVLLCGTLL